MQFTRKANLIFIWWLYVIRMSLCMYASSYTCAVVHFGRKFDGHKMCPVYDSGHCTVNLRCYM